VNAGEIMAREVICVGLGGVPGVGDVQAHLGRLPGAETPFSRPCLLQRSRRNFICRMNCIYTGW